MYTRGTCLSIPTGRRHCRRLEIVEPGIIGELLQPGGIRALERLGLSHTTTDAFVDSVEVKG